MRRRPAMPPPAWADRNSSADGGRRGRRQASAAEEHRHRRAPGGRAHPRDLGGGVGAAIAFGRVLDPGLGGCAPRRSWAAWASPAKPGCMPRTSRDGGTLWQGMPGISPHRRKASAPPAMPRMRQAYRSGAIASPPPRRVQSEPQISAAVGAVHWTGCGIVILQNLADHDTPADETCDDVRWKNWRE